MAIAGPCLFCRTTGGHTAVCRMQPGLARSDMTSTLDAMRRLDLHLVDCEGAVARGILRRAIAHLEVSLLEHLTGPDGYQRRLERQVA